MSMSFISRTLSVALFCFACAAPALAADTAAPMTEEAARKQAVALLDGGRVVRSETKKTRQGETFYTYVVINDNARAKVTFDADDGEMVKFEKEPIESVDVPNRMRGDEPRDTKLSIEDAKEIALEKAGGGDVVKLEKEYKKHGRVIYEIEVINGDMEHEIELDADTGAVLEYKAERNDGYKYKHRKGGKVIYKEIHR